MGVITKTISASGASRDAFSLEQKSLQHVTAVGHVHACWCETFQMPLTFQNPHALPLGSWAIISQTTKCAGCAAVRGEVCRLKAPYTSAKAMNWQWQYLLQFPKATLVFHSAQWARDKLVEHEQKATHRDLVATGNDCTTMTTAKRSALSVTPAMDLLVLHHHRLRDHGVQLEAPTWSHLNQHQHHQWQQYNRSGSIGDCRCHRPGRRSASHRRGRQGCSRSSGHRRSTGRHRVASIFFFLDCFRVIATRIIGIAVIFALHCLTIHLWRWLIRGRGPCCHRARVERMPPGHVSDACDPSGVPPDWSAQGFAWGRFFETTLAPGCDAHPRRLGLYRKS